MSSESPNVVVGSLLTPELQQRFTAAFPEATFTFCDMPDVPRHVEGVDYLIAWGLGNDDLARAKNLKWVQTISAGVDRMDLKALRDRGILVTNSSGVHAPNISEHIISLMLAFARRLPTHFANQRRHAFSSDEGRKGGFEVTDQTLLVVGLGKIGEALAVRGKGLQMRVLATRRRLAIQRESAADEVFPLSDLRQRIGEADHVAITLPLTPETRGLFDRSVLQAMKPGAYIYNIGRGAIIDQDAMIELLKTGHLGGAGLDVTTPEPLPEDSELWDLPNVIITPHTSGYSPRLNERAVALWTENLRRMLDGRDLLNVVDADAGY